MPHAPLILAGMHRSGTSLAASLLQAAGVRMGERLFPAGVGNVKGHFEDMDFVEFHADVLRAAGESWVGWTTRPDIPLSPELRSRAAALLGRKAAAAGASPWGWKDPRTTLFLDLWRDLAPGAMVVLMYRPPWEVIDSLYRRGSDEDMLADPANAVVYCQHYTRATLEFARRHPGRCLLVANDAVTADGRGFVAAVAKRFGLALGEPPADLFDASIMERSQSDRAALMAAVFPEAVDTFLELNAMAQLPAPGYDSAWRAALPSPQSAVVKDWMDVRALGRKVKQGLAREETLRQHVAGLERAQAALEAELRSVRAHAENLQARSAELERHAANLETMHAEAARDASAVRQELDREAGVRRAAEDNTRQAMAQAASLAAELARERSRRQSSTGLLADLLAREEASRFRKLSLGLKRTLGKVQRIWQSTDLHCLAGASGGDGRWRVEATGELAWAGWFRPAAYQLDLAGTWPGSASLVFSDGTRDVFALPIGTAGQRQQEVVLPARAFFARLVFDAAGDVALTHCRLSVR